MKIILMKQKQNVNCSPLNKLSSVIAKNRIVKLQLQISNNFKSQLKDETLTTKLNSHTRIRMRRKHAQPQHWREH